MIKEEISEAISALYRRGLITLLDGNISVKEGETIFITPGGLRKDRVKAEDVVEVKLNGEIIRGKPSSEFRLHLEIYRARDDVAAIVHAHPPFATSLAAAGISLEYPILAEAITFLGPVPIVPFAFPSTEGLARLVAEFAEKRDCFILENHGAVSIAENLDLALAMMETLEHAAEVLWRALLLGRVKLFTKEEVSELLNLRNTYGLPSRPWKPKDFHYHIPEE